MSEAALKIEEIVREPATVRRFELADLSTHGGWLLKRLAAIFPDLGERAIAGYLTNLVYNNEHMFLCQPHAVALAQMTSSPGIRPTKLVQERFVFVEDKNDKEQLEDAADFYINMRQWGRQAGAERIIVMENSDVPKSLVELRLGRLFDTKISHARV